MSARGWADRGGLGVQGRRRLPVHGIRLLHWDRPADRPTVDEEFGRAMSLTELPYLRITKPAKEVALALELGASVENAEGIH